MAGNISESQGDVLLKMARASIYEKLGYPSGDPETREQDSAFLERKQGLFVTLHKKGKLRGCIGNLEPVKTLREGIAENAVCAAFRDSRFSPLAPEELDLIEIEVSLLSQPEKLAFRDCRDLLTLLVPGKHGVIIEKGGCRATFLPQVWEQLPGCEAFLGHLCTKAGLASTAWKEKGMIVYTYEVQHFAEEP
ncbi:MAG: AmmeMemoRadiSam system protein A [Desulfobacterales bacterium]|nr:AmmeMemoRadiSam system protein A [Desulfobacterales bacterium]